MPIEHQRRLADGSKDPELPSADRHSLPEGGRGLQIIRELMDQATYTCEQNLNRLVMTKRIPLAVVDRSGAVRIRWIRPSGSQRRAPA